ncbi:MAG: isoprenylcysteine carboxylmethyltransferase family protein [Beijerinckiaceae bacterium]|nr:isoprenylcysteine carboxylmethyltransferase family protein [Beijerinckiaceae bacterium]MCI0736943.1 isoprenylcysteine carboxylmethyltransferase family protein [Beijerinckiaceae bacterium]
MQQGPWGIEPAADHPNVIASPALVFGAVLVLGFILDWLWPIKFLPEGWSLVAGFFLIFIAINIKTYAVRELVKLKTNLNVRKPANAIATEWPFSVSRNPVYGGMVLLNIGVACFVNALWILLFTPVLVLVLQKGVIEPEEVYLEQKFGDKYLRYKAKVRRWI